MHRRFAPIALLAALPVGLLAAVGAAVANLDGNALPPHGNATVTVGSAPLGQPLRPGFVGLSVEYNALEPYAGSNPGAIDPILIELIRNLSPLQPPVLRIGGNSTDVTWWPQRGEPVPRNGSYPLGHGWLATTRALVAALGARLILGLNLASGRSEVAANEAHVFLRGIGAGSIDAFEIGNEPDLYSVFPWYTDRSGRLVYARLHDYGLSDYIREFSRWRAAIGRSLPVAGPAFATFDWATRLARFVRSEPGLSEVTFHRYPLRACLTAPRAPGYPTIPSLLSDQSSTGLAQSLAPYVAVAHAHGLAFRLDELNSASCTGKWGVSNTFASSLWILDTLFSLARVGVDGVNVQTLPGAAYAPFSLQHTMRGWRAFVAPVYYGMLLFSEADPRGARLLAAKISARGPLKAWATQGPGPVTRVLLIDKDPRKPYEVRLRAPGQSAVLKRLEAPRPGSTRRVTLAGRSFDASGQLRGDPLTETVGSDHGVYSIFVPADSAVLVTLG